VRETIFEFVRDYIYIILGVVCVIVVGVIYVVGRGGSSSEIVREGEPLPVALYSPATADPTPEPEVEPASEPSPPSVPEVSATIFVHVVGEIHNPNVFELPYGSRVFEVLEMAGGLTDYADASAIIKSAVLQDEMQIRVPAIGEDVGEVFIFAEVPTPASSAAAAPATQADGRVNINTATEAELQTLTGIGPSRAQAIVRFRETHGNFSSVEELMRVPGIAEGILSSIRDLVTVGG